jgi:hypothetical protein
MEQQGAVISEFPMGRPPRCKISRLVIAFFEECRSGLWISRGEAGLWIWDPPEASHGVCQQGSLGCSRQRHRAFELRSQATDLAICKASDRLERSGEKAADPGEGRASACAGGIGAEPAEQDLAPTERPLRELLSLDPS